MNKYIFFARTIGLVGGAEIYLKNKYVFLKNMGYVVNVISSLKQEVYIKELDAFRDGLFLELQLNPFCFSLKQRNKILDNIIDLITPTKDDNIIIESHTINLSLWAELLAERLKAFHFVFLINEFLKLNNSTVKHFLEKKLERDEVVGISKASLYQIFSKELLQNKTLFLPAYCSNSIEKTSPQICLNPLDYDIKLGCISRLDKPCVDIISKELQTWIKKNSEQRILVIFFGGSSGKEKKILEKEFQKFKNCRCIITGFLYPISYYDLKNIDLFISVAGAARATTNIGIPTLTIDQKTGKVFGILDYNTNNSIYSNVDSVTDFKWCCIGEALNDIFVERTLSLDLIKLPEKELVTNFDYSVHLDFIKNRVYQYNQEIPNLKKSLRKYDIFLKFFITLFGFKTTLKIKKMIYYVKSLLK